MRLQYAFEDLAALRRLRIGDSHAGYLETLFRVPLGVIFAQAQS